MWTGGERSGAERGDEGDEVRRAPEAASMMIEMFDYYFNER